MAKKWYSSIQIIQKMSKFCYWVKICHITYEFGGLLESKGLLLSTPTVIRITVDTISANIIFPPGLLIRRTPTSPVLLHLWSFCCNVLAKIRHFTPKISQKSLFYSLSYFKNQFQARFFHFMNNSNYL